MGGTSPPPYCQVLQDFLGHNWKASGWSNPLCPLTSSPSSRGGSSLLEQIHRALDQGQLVLREKIPKRLTLRTLSYLLQKIPFEWVLALGSVVQQLASVPSWLPVRVLFALSFGPWSWSWFRALWPE